ncbi:MAG: hypothetical protein FWC41_02425, partial [Firmicutes bacterium]|nr:hypothetical protein [Bacillota bacterium]
MPEIDINIEGDVLVFDKPYQCTSFDLVGKVKKYIRQQETESRKQKTENNVGTTFTVAQKQKEERKKIKVGH